MVILNFHGLGPQSKYSTPGEAAYWLSLEHFTAILDAVSTRTDVEITFDDSFESDFSVALPLLKARKLSARFFVVAGRVGKPGFLSLEQVQCLRDEGMTIGSHGMSHRKWPDLEEAALGEELNEARDRIEQMIGIRVVQASCPFGGYDRRVLRHLRKAGFQNVYTSDGGSATPYAWIQPRNTIVCSDDLAKVMRIVTRVPSGSAALWRLSKLALKRWR